MELPAISTSQLSERTDEMPDTSPLTSVAQEREKIPTNREYIEQQIREAEQHLARLNQLRVRFAEHNLLDRPVDYLSPYGDS